ncbi:hypothetical protein DVB69_16255 [Sporosarcina sp. BI001-red]|uniref:hypothetical protein n=1 Tax=Sporosarcina sp. BI001-red TaxID=2282866 RepID=UPI000E250C51|nr:hypothetical protein [Sporosarcina sp. BI001-red]REB05298.1 hypothetical protein DVB69_16255 [Sporosarcina sp. BI001-red]
MKKLILAFVFLVLATALTISNSTLLNGMTTIEIAHKLPILLMPADFTYFIRPIIFLFLAYWIVKFYSNGSLSIKRILLFITACLGNAAWFPLWNYGYYGWASLLTTVGLLSLYALYRTYPSKQNEWGQRIPVALLFSWTLIDFVMNANYLLVLDEWNRLGLSSVLWSIINLTILTAIALHFSYHHRDWVISIVFMWVYLGILVNIGFEELFVTLSTLFLMVIMILGLFMFAPSTTSKKIKVTSS